MNCEHYQRNVEIKANCCGKWFACRVCHDDVSDHYINRFKTELIKCIECSTVQPISNHCVNNECQFTEKPFATYFCYNCRLYDNSGKDIFHCDDCGICRIGNPDEYEHCHTCGICIKGDGNHHCHAKSYEGQCVICMENLFDSRSPVITLTNCTHKICQSCHHDYVQHDKYTCPICKRSMHDMTVVFERIDAYMQLTKMPIQYENSQSQITCNDCQQKSIVSYHFMYHKCLQCGSYNTDILKTMNLPDLNQEIELDTDTEIDN